MNLGNSLTALYPVQFEAPQQKGFQLGLNYLDPYLYKLGDESRYYNNLKPLTSLFYLQGTKELIFLDAKHSQNILPNWNVGIDYRRYKEEGQYLRQSTGIYNTRIYNWFHTKDYRYHVLADLVWNRLDNQESGGIYTKESFDTLTGPVRQATVRYFGDLDQEARNIVRTNTYSLTQIYRFGESKNFPTDMKDSLGGPVLDTVPTFIPKGQVRLKTEYGWQRNLFVINSLDGLDIQNFYLDSTATYDSLSYQNFNVTLGFESGQYFGIDDSFKVKQQPLSYAIEGTYEGVKVGWVKDFAQYNNVLVSGRIGSNPFYEKHDFQWKVSAYSALMGYNVGDYEVNFHASKHIGLFHLKANVGSKAYSPSFNQTYYFGNHDFWKLPNLKKQFAQTGSFGVNVKGDLLQLKAAYTSLANYIYLNLQPEQLNKTISIAQVSAKTHLRFKALNWQASFIYQPVKNEALPLPEFTTKQTLYLQGYMFKNALLAKLGVDFFYNTGFKAPVYNAPLRMWQIQQTGENFLIGNYPYFNLYFTGRIKTVTFFAMMQHVTAGIFRTDYYSSPYYPMAPRAFRFGIKWTLFE